MASRSKSAGLTHAAERRRGNGDPQANVERGSTDRDEAYIRHELEAHQLELAMQNAELRATQSELQAALDRCAELERYVDERTRELRIANESLQRELAARLRIERELRASESGLRTLASEAALAEERERKRLAADLHDGLGQLLTLARVKLKAHGRASGEPLRDVARLLSDAQERAESLMFQLSPPLLRDVGLRAACQWLAEEITKLYGLAVDVDADGEHRWLDEVVPVTLYRAVRELLLNAAVHANATRAHVCIRTEAPVLRITVEDDGDGFAAGAEKAFGLRNLEERLNHLGGGLDIASAPPRGTKVAITLPTVPLETLTEEAPS